MHFDNEAISGRYGPLSLDLSAICYKYLLNALQIRTLRY